MKIWKFLKKTLCEFKNHCKYFGFSYAFYNLVWWLCFYIRTPFSLKISTWAIKKKTSWIDQYIEKHYIHIINKYRESSPEGKTVESHNIWVFWGQGEENMPPLIRSCYRQLCHFNKNVVLVTNNNVREYIDLPPIIFEKVNDGRITWAHFSDIVRTTLLTTYGGLWLDATVWVSGKLPWTKLSAISFFSANSPTQLNCYSCCFWTSFEWSWSGWCLYSKYKNHKLLSFVSEMLKLMAEREKGLLDYVIIDYLIYYACRKFPSIAADMERCQSIPCKHRNTLASIMNQAYNEETYRNLIKTDFVFKLSFRSPWTEKTGTGEQTFYGRLLSDIIESH